MKKFKFGLSGTDRICLTLLALTVLAAGAAEQALDASQARRPLPARQSPMTVVSAAPGPFPDMTLLVEETTPPPSEPDPYQEEIPLSRELQEVLWDACEGNGVPLCLMLGLIEVESGFQPDAVSREGCFGLCQLNPKYYPADLSPRENLIAGVEHLATQLERYGGDTQAALTAYNAGYDTGSRRYARAVLDASEKWGNG